MYALKYPIGLAQIPAIITSKHINNWIASIESLPHKLELLTINLTDDQLNTAYRDNGWSIRQVIHHIADSHQNSYIRFKWALTENKPLIKAYYEDRWAELKDAKTAPIELSLNVIKALHAKWVFLLKGLSENQLKTTFIHPENLEEVMLNKNIGIYAWHSEHHYEHINQLLIRKGWK